MITITTVPPSTATTQTLSLQIKEKMVPYCNPNTLGGTVSYKVGPVRLVDGNALANVTATVTINYQSCGCRYARTAVFQESFLIAFEVTGNNNIEVADSEIVIYGSDYKCCKPHSATIETTIVATIS